MKKNLSKCKGVGGGRVLNCGEIAPPDSKRRTNSLRLDTLKYDPKIERNN